MAQVTLYTTPTCGYCKVAKAFFQEHNVEYVEKDVTVDAEARQELMEKSKGQTVVPVITVDEQVFIGFDKEGLSRALNIH